ncbi:MAG TPA: SDR family oxidoreductase [Steroidobacteraceae bacterium]|nr:SDR family oxidoreductase [Steroidobacteraceae bacterium]
MNIAGKVIVVTGGGSGIGEALCTRFASSGARAVAVADRDHDRAQRVARAIDGLALQCDVAVERELLAAIERVEGRLGPIDLFCSNAGVGIHDKDPEDPASAPDSAWALSWGVHVMSHVYAARALGPKMARRGHGYFLNTVSAAGLLTQIGSGPYSTTKHAAIGFAESLAIAYRDRGVGVSVLCPQGVATPMVEGAMSTPAISDGLLTADQVADVALEGLAEERFLILPHAQVATYMQRKASDYDRWLAGMRKLRRRMLDASNQ